MGALVGEAVPVMSRRWALLAQLALGALGVVIVLLTLSLGTRSPLAGLESGSPSPSGVALASTSPAAGGSPTGSPTGTPTTSAIAGH